MLFCKHCKTLMKKVIRFENGNFYKLSRCPKCYTEMKPKRYFFEDEQISRNNTKANQERR